MKLVTVAKFFGNLIYWKRCIP